MDDNWRIAIGYFCVALVLISVFIGGAWILSPQEFTFKVEMDNNTKEAIESVEYPIVNEMSDVYFGNLENCTLVQTECDCWEEFGCFAMCYKCEDVNVLTDESGGKDGNQ